MFNSEIVISLGHSQLLQWIEELTGTLENYKIAEQLRKEIRQLKKLESTKEVKKEIGEKYLRLYDLQFERYLVSIQFDKKSQFDHCCKNLIINGKHFKRLLGTPGGLKMSTVLFVDSDIYDELMTRINNNRRDYEIKNAQEVPIKHSVSKLEAYFALTSSTSSAAPWPKMIVVPGTFTKFKDDVIEVSDGEKENDDPVVKKVWDKEIELEINDGCGIMTPEYSSQVNKTLTGNDEIVSGICARCAFLKGMLFTFDFKEFAEKIAHKHTVMDAWGHEQNIDDADVIITTSQLKLWNSYRSYEEYETACKNNKYDFRITKVSEKVDESRNLNYQFTQSYYLNDDDIEELISPTVNEIEDILQLDPRKSIVYLAGASLNDNNVQKIDNVAKALMIDERLIDDPYVRSRIEHMIQKKIRLAKISTIDVDGNFSLISGDPYAMCEDIFGLPVKGLVNAGEIYYKFWMDKNVPEVVCMRAPMCAHYNVVKQKICYNEQAQYWFRYIKDCIILNSWDTLRMAESGADCDGDILFTTNNPVLVNKHRKLPALDCQQRGAVKVESSLITDEMIAQTNKRSFKSNVGSITNVGTAMLNL